MLRTQSLRCVWILIGWLSALSGCSKPLVLNVEDAVAIPGRQTRFCAWLGQGYTMAFKRDIRDAPVRFYVDGRQVAQAITNKDGQAIVDCTLPLSKATSFEAKTEARNLSATAQGNIYRWSKNKTIIAVDIDDTISDTNYSDLFISDLDHVSKPIDSSRDVLEVLSKDYHIYYFSARPRFLHQKSRQWLEENRYPMGPIAHASKFEACLRQTTYKRRMLADLRARYPNMLIGIGDRSVDEKAFGSNQMLTVLVSPSRFGSYGPECVLCRDWKHVNALFTSHRQLTNPRQVLAVIDKKATLSTPVLVGEPTGPSASRE